MRPSPLVTMATVLAAAAVLAVAQPQTVSAKAPPGRYQVAAATVTDLVTGLRWQRNTAPAKVNRAAAAQYCAGLALDGPPGSWRLPAVRELMSLVDRRATQPAIDTQAFPGTKLDMYWSSTPVAGKPGQGWGIAFNQGDTYFQQPTYVGWVRCVQDAPKP